MDKVGFGRELNIKAKRDVIHAEMPGNTMDDALG